MLYFADICAGPGGFSEYMLWRKKWHAKGFGFTLKGTTVCWYRAVPVYVCIFCVLSCADPKSGSDFKLDNFFAAPCETFDPHYGKPYTAVTIPCKLVVPCTYCVLIFMQPWCSRKCIATWSTTVLYRRCVRVVVKSSVTSH